MFRSIRWRILAWNLCLLAATTTALLLAFYRHERENRLQAIDLHLRATMARHSGAVNDLIPQMRPPVADGRPRRPQDTGERLAGARKALDDMEQENAWVLVLDATGTVLLRSRRAPTDSALIGRCRDEAADGRDADGLDRAPVNRMVSFLGHRMLVYHPPNRIITVYGTDTGMQERELGRLGWKLGLAGAAVVILGGAIGWILACRSLRPIGRIARTAESIAAGDYARRIDTTDTESELGQLAVVLNDTFARLDAARERVTQFTADASHELRTPLTVILSDSQRALQQERTPGEYRETLETIRRAATRMKTISDGLIELAQGDLGRTAGTSPADLADLADDAVTLLGRLAREKGASVETRLEGAPVNVDPARMGRAILNLVMNALLHNPPSVSVTVSTGSVEGQAELTVSDNGRGIPTEDLARIFERFHRVKSGNAHHAEGAGLGLAIVRQTVEACGGTIAVSSEIGRGTTFRVRLPLAR